MKTLAASSNVSLSSSSLQCDKVSKTRRTLLGSFRLAHGQSIDDVDQKILKAK